MKILSTIVLSTIFATVVRGQSGIPEGVVTRCYSTSDCSGPENDTLCQLFNRTIPGDVNYCCFEDQTTPRSDPGNLSFRLNGGTCTPCDDPSVINPGPNQTVCYANCYPDSPGSTTGVGVVTSNDTNFDDNNVCCNGASTMQGFTFNGQLETVMNTSCTRCHEIGTDATVGCDPHFFLPLENGDHICFSIQGQPDFAFNLISDKYINLNGQFVLPAEEESHTISNVSTFLGDLGLLITNQKTNSTTAIKVSAVDHSVLVGNSLTVVKDKPVTVDVFGKVTTTIDAKAQANRLKDESAWLYINTDGFGIKVRFYKKHLDMLLTKTNGLTKNAYGLIGQFLTADVKIDFDNMLMQLGDRKPISVKRDKAWPFLGINEECWYGTATDNQVTEIIEGVYIDYVVEHLI